MLSAETLLAYLPSDRKQALAAGSDLPGQAQGAALWADLSGFTSLTETLARKLGPRHGAEELALYLNRFYDALIAPVEAYAGSVVGFSGDAITCWFDADDVRRVVAAGLAMQAAMQPFASLQLATGETISLGIKIAICAGSVRRFRVGDPAVQYLDTLAGATLDRLAEIGHLAGTGELLVDESTVDRLQVAAQIDEWRTSARTGRRAAVFGGLPLLNKPSSLIAAPLPGLTEEQVRPWLLPAVFARLQAGQGEFLTELRPAVALFMHFAGLDYDGDEQAGAKLDGFIRRVQAILVEYDGTLLQLTIGDKGSYLYAAFGAPVAHEDDAVRAVASALELSRLPAEMDSIHSIGIGLSRGVMRTGAYGATSRRTYGVLGDEVNLAARLMERAAPGQVLASETVWQATASDFAWEVLPAFEVKGKRVPVMPASLLERRKQKELHLPPAAAGYPMIGRRAELALVLAKLDLARQGHGQIVSITGEAGMGKSRLLAEVLKHIGTDGPAVYSGECQSYGTQSSYLVWQTIWRAFFGTDPAGTLADQIRTLEIALAGIDPNLLERLPLLGAALNLSIPNNGLTAGLDARARKSSREALLADCLQARAGEHPLILILEDLHWIDPLSRDLLGLIGRLIRELPVLIVLAFRPPVVAEANAFLSGLSSLGYTTEIRLVELTSLETEEFIAARLAHFGSEGAVVPALVERMLGRTQGNPFYIEELLRYLHDRGLDPRSEAAWEQVDLPDSLQSLILSRIDQLSEQQQITIKAASIIGRLFRAVWLYDYYPPLGGPSRVSADLEILNHLEFTVLETPEPQLAYLFKHVITREVAYESLAYATRASLHEQFASYLELVAGQDVGPYLDLLAYHYERSANLAKKREYLRKAGEAAQAAFANETALSYLRRALVLAPETDYAEQFDILAAREKVLDVMANRDLQAQDLTALAKLADVMDDNGRRAQVAISRSSYAQKTTDYPKAIEIAYSAVEFAKKAGVVEFEVYGYVSLADAVICQANYAEARKYAELALALAQKAGLVKLNAATLDLLGQLEIFEANYDSARTYLERALNLYREAGRREEEVLVLYKLGEIDYMSGDLAQAAAYYEETLHSNLAMGNPVIEGMARARSAMLMAERRGDLGKARLYLERALVLLQDGFNRKNIGFSLYCLGYIDVCQNNYLVARNHTEDALFIHREIGHKYFQGASLEQLGDIADQLGQYDLAFQYRHQGLSLTRELGERSEEGLFLIALGAGYYHRGEYEKASEYSQQGLIIKQEIKDRMGQLRPLIFKGHALREKSDLDEAAHCYQQALSLALDLGLLHFAYLAKTGLACTALAQGKLVEAMAPMDEILDYLETHLLTTLDEIPWIYLTCYRILQANADPRAWPTLTVAYTWLQDIAARIDDEALRASFLQNVRFNRELVQAWENYSSS